MYAFKTYRKIDVAINGAYAYSTNAYRTCKEAIAALQEKQSIIVASVPNYTVTLRPDDKITAHFARR